MKYVLLFALFAIAFTIGPFLLIWSLNTLFVLNIAFDVKTWVAAWILIAMFAATRST